MAAKQAPSGRGVGRHRFQAPSYAVLLAILLAWSGVAQFMGQGNRTAYYLCLSNQGCLEQFAGNLGHNPDLSNLLNNSLAPNQGQPGSLNSTGMLAGALQLALNASSCCYYVHKEFVGVIGEVTPQLPLLRWQLSQPHQGGDLAMPEALQPDVHVSNLEFSSQQDIVDYQEHWQDKYVMDVVDMQYSYYITGMTPELVANPDNAGQDEDSPHGLLYPRLFYLLFYRLDVLARFNISTSSLSTWEGLLAAGQKLAGQDFDGDGQVDYPFCLDLQRGCHKAVYLYSQIAASLVQAHGTAQGWCWDPNDMVQLILRPAIGRRVAQILSGLAALAQPNATSSCSAANSLFANTGATNTSLTRCAFTFDWDIASNLFGPPYLGDTAVGSTPAVGALLPPGVTDPFNRTLKDFEPCNPYHCPFAQVEDTGQPGNPRALVNRAPLSTMAVPSLQISSTKPKDVQLAAIRISDTAASLMPTWVQSQEVVLRQLADQWRSACASGHVAPLPVPLPEYANNSGTQPTAVAWANTSNPACAVPAWTSPPLLSLTPSDQWQPLASFSPNRATLDDMTRIIPALWQARWHPNGAPDLAVPLATFYRATLDELAVAIVAAGSAEPALVDGLLAAATDKFKAVTAVVSSGNWGSNLTGYVNSSGAKEYFDLLYRKSINNQNFGNFTGGQVWPGNRRMTNAQVVIAAVVPTAVLLAVGALGLLCWARAWRHRSLLLGKVKAPGLSPLTTLMITDIYNSTVLWESLPSAVMDTALRLHHQVMRTAAAKHGGYESALEGDAFILAFHHPLDAVRAALEVQAGLLAAPWPTELLQHPDAREVWVSLPQAAVEPPPANKPAGGLLAARSMSAVFSGPGFHTRGEVFGARKRARASSKALQPIRKQVEGTTVGANGAVAGMSGPLKLPGKLRQLLRRVTRGVSTAAPAVAVSDGSERHDSSSQSRRRQRLSQRTTAQVPDTSASLPTTTSLEASDSAELQGNAPEGPHVPQYSRPQPLSIPSAPALQAVPESPSDPVLPVPPMSTTGSGRTEAGTKPLMDGLDVPLSSPLPEPMMVSRRAARHFDLEAGLHSVPQQQQQQQQHAALARRRSAAPDYGAVGSPVLPNAIPQNPWHAPPLLQRAGTMLGGLWRGTRRSASPWAVIAATPNNSHSGAIGGSAQPYNSPPGRSFTLTRMQSSRWLNTGSPFAAAGSPDGLAGIPSSSMMGRAHAHPIIFPKQLLAQYAADANEDLGPVSGELRHHASEPNYMVAAQLIWPPSSHTRSEMVTSRPPQLQTGGSHVLGPAPAEGGPRTGRSRLALPSPRDDSSVTTMTTFETSGDASPAATTPAGQGPDAGAQHIALSLDAVNRLEPAAASDTASDPLTAQATPLPSPCAQQWPHSQNQQQKQQEHASDGFSASAGGLQPGGNTSSSTQHQAAPAGVAVAEQPPPLGAAMLSQQPPPAIPREPLSYVCWRQLCAVAWPLLGTQQSQDNDDAVACHGQQQQRPVSMTATAPLPGTPSATAGVVVSVAASADTTAAGQPQAHGKAGGKVITAGAVGGVALFKTGSCSCALLFRGLRVRMGLHSGVHSTSDMALNRTTQAWAYSGYPLKLAKAVGDAAAGGMVLLSGATFNLVANQLATLPGAPTPIYMGDSLFDLPGAYCNSGPVGEGAWARDAVPLYCLVVPELRPRLAHHEPLRGVDMVQLGNLDASTGVVCIAFVYVAGAAGLVAELGHVGTDALDVFQLMVTKLCCDYGGYVIEATEGLCLAAFADPAACALWALSCMQHMKQHEWDPTLLAHELCQEVVTVQPGTGTLVPVQRGPRLRAGLHTGHCEVHINPRTGRMAYRGRVMNRAARIASKAQDGQVLCSAAALSQWGSVVSARRPSSPSLSTRSIMRMMSPCSSSPTTNYNSLHPLTPTAPNVPVGTVFHVVAQPSPPQQQRQQQVYPPGQVRSVLAHCASRVREQRPLLRAECVGTFALKGVSEMMTLYACSLADPEQEAAMQQEQQQ